MEGSCNGFVLTGYLKGKRCGANPMHIDKDGNKWCSNHYAKVLDNPNIFDKYKKNELKQTNK